MNHSPDKLLFPFQRLFVLSAYENKTKDDQCDGKTSLTSRLRTFRGEMKYSIVLLYYMYLDACRVDRNVFPSYRKANTSKSPCVIQ